MFRKVVVGCLLAFAPVAALSANQTTTSQSDLQSQLKALDKEIKEFKEARDQSKMEGYIAGRNADQYLGQNWVDYQQAVQQQEMYQQQVKDLNEKIVQLEKQRADLVSKMNAS